MAGDWIKWTKGLPDKPEVVRIAAALGLTREVAVCRLMRLWEWCDDNIADDAIRENGSAFVELSPSDGDNAAFVDALVGTPNFANSLALVGWIRFRSGRIELPNFGRHNGETAKTRARNAKNQKRKRQQPDAPSPPPVAPPVTGPPQQMSPSRGDIPVTRGEERREDKTPPTPPAEPGGGAGGGGAAKPRKADRSALGGPDFDRFWAAYPRKVAKPDAARAFAKLAPHPDLVDRMLAALAWQCRSEGWTREGGRFVPHPATWLNARRWEDEPPRPALAPAPPDPARTVAAVRRLEDESATGLHPDILRKRKLKEASDDAPDARAG